MQYSASTWVHPKSSADVNGGPVLPWLDGMRDMPSQSQPENVTRYSYNKLSLYSWGLYEEAKK